MLIKGLLRVRGKEGMLNLKPAEAVKILNEKGINASAMQDGITLPPEEGWTSQAEPTDGGDGVCVTYSLNDTPILQQWSYTNPIEEFYQLIIE